MKYVASIAILATFLGLAGCSSNQSVTAAPQGGYKALPTNDDPNMTPGNGDMPAPPAGAQFTLLCTAFSGPTHIADANRYKDYLIQRTGSKNWYVIHNDTESNLYFGYYKSFDDRTQVAEYGRAQTDRAKISSMLNENGDRLFDQVFFVPISMPDPAAPKDWDVVNAPGYWTIRIAIYQDNPMRKQAAVESVRAARAAGVVAFYHHGESASEVFVGCWPRNAVKEGESDSASNSDASQPVLVLSGPIEGAGSPDFHDAANHHYKIMAPRIVPLDPTLKAALAQYPNTYINGERRGKRISGMSGPSSVMPYPSFLVAIPHDPAEQAKFDQRDATAETGTGPADANPVPGNAGGTQPQPAQDDAIPGPAIR